jgi:hypothetical protein
MSDILYHGYGDSPADLYDLAKKWGMSPERLKFLKSCPHEIHRKFLTDRKAWNPEEKRIAAACRLAYRQSFTAYEAAEYAKVPLGVVTAFLERVGVTWPPGCRRKLAWGGSSTLNARRMYGNLLAGGPMPKSPRKDNLSSADIVREAAAHGVTLRKAAEAHGVSYQTLYAASRRIGVRVARAYRPRTVKGKVRL